MTYRGIYRDGYVRLQGDVDLRNGAAVNVSPADKASLPNLSARLRRSKSTRTPAPTVWERVMNKRMTRRERIAAALAACGDWKDRPEWKGMTSVQIAAELRRRAASRGRHV